MKLTSVLNPHSVPGCYNGTLYLEISAQTDWQESGTGWRSGARFSSNLEQTYGLDPDTEVMINLNVGDDSATRANLRIVGQMKVKHRGRIVANSGGPWGEGGGIMIPSKTPPSHFQMSGSWARSGARLGFWLPVPWNGQGAVCHGFWWAHWPVE